MLRIKTGAAVERAQPSWRWLLLGLGLTLLLGLTGAAIKLGLSSPLSHVRVFAPLPPNCSSQQPPELAAREGRAASEAAASAERLDAAVQAVRRRLDAIKGQLEPLASRVPAPAAPVVVAPPPNAPLPELRVTFEKGDELDLFCWRLCEWGMRAVAGHRLNITCRANWDEAQYALTGGYRPGKWNPPSSTPGPNRVGFLVENIPKAKVADSDAVNFWGTRPPAHLTKWIHLPIAFTVFSHARRSHFHHPELLLRSDGNPLLPEFPGKQVLAWKEKDRFCAFVATACTMDHYMGIYQLEDRSVKDQPLIRTMLFDQLSASYKQVDALGPCRHNREPPVIPPWTTSALLSEQTINWFHRYKFAICFENGAGPGWITEKLFDAYLGMTIPVYWGPSDIFDERYNFNMDAFVYCAPDNLTPDPEAQFYWLPNATFKKCIEEIKRLDKDDEAYAAKLAQPIFRDNKIPAWMHYDTYARQLLDKWGV